MSYRLVLECTLNKDEEASAFDQYLENFCKTKQVYFASGKEHSYVELCVDGSIDVHIQNNKVECIAVPMKVGAGFHAAVCDFFQAIIDDEVYECCVYDPTKYMQHKDFQRLKKEFFEASITYMKSFLKQQEKHSFYSLFMHKQYTPVAKEGCVITNFGYLGFDEIQKMSIEALMDIFFYWNEKEKNARFYRNMAMYLLWRECYFEYSMMNETTLKYAEQIIAYLEIANELDKELELPYDIYTQLCKVLHTEPMMKPAKQLHTFPIGYRKQNVFFQCYEWMIQMPGCNEIHYNDSLDYYTITGPFKEDELWKYTIFLSKSLLQQTTTFSSKPLKKIYDVTNALHVMEEHFQEENFHHLLLEVSDDLNNDKFYIHAVCTCEESVNQVRSFLSTITFDKTQKNMNQTILH